MLQQKPCSRNVEIPGGRGVHQRPPWNGNSKGVGGCKPKTFRGRGMDIFWNHTLIYDSTTRRFDKNFNFNAFLEFTERRILHSIKKHGHYIKNKTEEKSLTALAFGCRVKKCSSPRVLF